MHLRKMGCKLLSLILILCLSSCISYDILVIEPSKQPTITAFVTTEPPYSLDDAIITDPKFEKYREELLKESSKRFKKFVVVAGFGDNKNGKLFTRLKENAYPIEAENLFKLTRAVYPKDYEIVMWIDNLEGSEIKESGIWYFKKKVWGDNGPIASIWDAVLTNQ